MDPEPVLDRDVIDSLRQLNQDGEPDLVAEVFTLFLHDAPQRLAAIEAALKARDAVALQRAAHALKGAAANVGAVRLQRLCRELEEIGRSGSADAAAGRLAPLRGAFAELQLAIDELL
jgi:HPt (histidine-containing phosphotransfer) domain-containing protein